MQTEQDHDTAEPIITAPASEVRAVKSSVDIDEIMKNCVPMPEWQDVLDVVKKSSMSVATAFDHTKAYTSGDYILIESENDLPFSMLKSQRQRESMRRAIKEVTGRVYKLGPYKSIEKHEEKVDPLKSLAHKLEQSGVEVITEDGD